MKKISVILLFPLLLICIFNGGCGLVSILGSPSASEDFVSAKFDLSTRYDEKVLIIVEQPAWISSPLNLRREITEKMNAYMRLYLKKMPTESIISYDEVREIAKGDITFANKDVLDIAGEFDAGVVIFVEIVDFEFNQLTAAGYCSASMKTLTTLYDGKTGDILWPQARRESLVSVAVDLERGADLAIARIATANAHCIIRNFYDCPKLQYRVIEEQQRQEIDPW